jgi:hypothetical protein
MGGREGRKGKKKRRKEIKRKQRVERKKVKNDCKRNESLMSFEPCRRMVEKSGEKDGMATNIDLESF